MGIKFPRQALALLAIVLALLFLLLFCFKTSNFLNWSWWWVFAPLWVPVVVVWVGFAIALLSVVIKENRKKYISKNV